MFAFFQLRGTSHCHHDFLKIILGVALQHQNPIWSHGFVCVQFKCSLTCSSSTESNLHAPDFLPGCRASDSWKLYLLYQGDTSFVIKTRAHSAAGPHFPMSSLTASITAHIEDVIALHVPLPASALGCFGFPNPILASSDSARIFFPCYLALIPCLVCFLFVLDKNQAQNQSVRSSLYILAGLLLPLLV